MTKVMKDAEKLAKAALRYKLGEEEMKGILEIANGDVDKAVRIMENTANMIKKYQK